MTLTLLPHFKRKKIIDLPGRVMDSTKLAYPNLALAGGPIAGFPNKCRLLHFDVLSDNIMLFLFLVTMPNG
jgi:hypothetical protein